MNTSRSIRSMNQFVYGYPVELRFDNKSRLEYFVTFDKPNLFIEPYDNLWIKLAATFIFLLGLLGSSVQFSFIVYEACGYAASYRTAINQLVSSSYFVLAMYSSFATGMDLLRVWYGPLPAGFCQFCKLFKSTLGNTCPFIVAGLVILKFLYICVWQRLREIDDRFITHIIVTLAYFYGFSMQLIKSLAPGKPTFNTVFCTGVYKSSYEELDKKFTTEIGLLIPILVCQILVPIIQKRKNKLNNVETTVVAANQHTPNHESLTLYFIVNIFFVIAVVSIALANGSEPFRWDEYQNKLYLLYVQFITGLQAGVLPAVLILKKMKISFIQEMLIEVNT